MLAAFIEFLHSGHLGPADSSHGDYRLLPGQHSDMRRVGARRLTVRLMTGSNFTVFWHERQQMRRGSASLYRSSSGIRESNVQNCRPSDSPPTVVLYLLGSRPRMIGMSYRSFMIRPCSYLGILQVLRGPCPRWARRDARWVGGSAARGSARSLHAVRSLSQGSHRVERGDAPILSLSLSRRTSSGCFARSACAVFALSPPSPRQKT